LSIDKVLIVVLFKDVIFTFHLDWLALLLFPVLIDFT